MSDPIRILSVNSNDIVTAYVSSGNEITITASSQDILQLYLSDEDS